MKHPFVRAFFRTCWLTLTHFVHVGRVRTSMKTQPNERPAIPLQGSVTVRYPREQLPIPDHGRNQLHNAIEDCILCDKCARICPVDCIEIESIRSPELLGNTSNGMPKRLHAARFDIDMAKCCFCGLCTVVCPTESLSMQPVYDYSTEQVATHTLSFATLSQEEVRAHRVRWQEVVATKKA